MITLDEKLPPQGPPPAYAPQKEENVMVGYPSPQYPPEMSAAAGSMPASSMPRSPYPPQQPPNAGGYPDPGSPVGARSQAMLDAQIGSAFQQQLYARCARGDHDIVTKYGACGIITGVMLFPIGLICTFMDTDRKCSRCGERFPR